MFPNDSSPEATVESLRPSSAWTSRTNDSTFADSAISMGGTGTSTPKQFSDDQLELRSPSSPKQSLSERLTELAAVAWAAEQDGYMDDITERKTFRAVKSIEASLEERAESTEQDEFDQDVHDDNAEEQHSEDVTHLTQIHDHLAATMSEMRLRHLEQRHMHEMTIRKLDDVAKTCATQKEQMRDMQAKIESLKLDNQKLHRDNDGFQAHAEQLTSELEHKDIALQAMSSAVAGLDGWISNSFTLERHPIKRMRASRGRGRFQTHYYVDVPVENSGDTGLDAAIDLREVRDGVTAWVRGFRDVEEAMSTNPNLQSPTRHRITAGVAVGARSAVSDVTEEDEWGEFQTVSSATGHDRC